MKQTALNQLGISLIEVILMLGAVIFLVLLIGNLPLAVNLIGRANHQSIAREIVTKKIEDIRITPYSSLANGQTSIVDTRLKLLPTSTGVALIEDCPVTICTLSEDAKNVTVTVTWIENGKDQTNQIHTIVANGGLK
jgi:hypothetical protein